MSESYYSALDPPSRKWYDEKTGLIENNSYTLSENEFLIDFDNFPLIYYPDVVSYLVFRPSPYSADDMKAYKRLEAYNQVIEGWVRDEKVNLDRNGLTVVQGKVGCSTVQLLHTTIVFSLKKLWNHYTVFNIFVISFLGFAFTKTEWTTTSTMGHCWEKREGIVCTLLMHGRISRGLQNVLCFD